MSPSYSHHATKAAPPSHHTSRSTTYHPIPSRETNFTIPYHQHPALIPSHPIHMNETRHLKPHLNLFWRSEQCVAIRTPLRRRHYICVFVSGPLDGVLQDTFSDDIHASKRVRRVDGSFNFKRTDPSHKISVVAVISKGHIFGIFASQIYPRE